MSEPSKLEDFILPVIVESAAAYNPKKVKAQFLELTRILAKQAFWLEIYQFLDANAAHVEGVHFDSPQSWKAASEWMKIVGKPGADPKVLARAEKVFSRARGKFAGDSTGNYAMRNMISQCVRADGMARVGELELMLERTLGADLYGLRRASMESKDLGTLLSGATMDALAGRPKARSL